MHHASLKADEIKLDIRKGCFDTTLEKYKPPKVKPVKVPPVEEPTPPPSLAYLNELVDNFKD